MNENINLDEYVDGPIENEFQWFLILFLIYFSIDPDKDVLYSKLNEGEILKDVCVICLEPQEGKASSDEWVAMLPCGHSFHEGCFLQHVMFENNKCCLCRKKFNCDQNNNDN